MTSTALGTFLQSSPPPAPSLGGGGGEENSAPIIPNITLQFDIIAAS